MDMGLQPQVESWVFGHLFGGNREGFGGEKDGMEPTRTYFVSFVRDRKQALYSFQFATWRCFLLVMCRCVVR